MSSSSTRSNLDQFEASITHNWTQDQEWYKYEPLPYKSSLNGLNPESRICPSSKIDGCSPSWPWVGDIKEMEAKTCITYVAFPLNFFEFLVNFSITKVPSVLCQDHSEGTSPGYLTGFKVLLYLLPAEYTNILTILVEILPWSREPLAIETIQIKVQTTTFVLQESISILRIPKGKCYNYDQGECMATRSKHDRSHRARCRSLVYRMHSLLSTCCGR